MIAPLAEIPRLVLEIVAKVIETELVVRTVGDIRSVGLASRARPKKLMHDLEAAKRVALRIIRFFFALGNVARIIEKR